MHESAGCYGIYFECAGFINGFILPYCHKGAGAKYQE